MWSLEVPGIPGDYTEILKFGQIYADSDLHDD